MTGIKQKMIAHLEANPALRESHAAVYWDLQRRGSGNLPDYYKKLATQWGLK